MHKVSFCLFLVLFSASLWKQSDGYSMGAPDSACGQMQPGHGFDPQPGDSPFVLELESLATSPGEGINIKLKGINETTFKGFIIQARNATDLESPVGSFETDADDANYVTCGRGIHNSITHRRSNDKSQMTAKWVAPSDMRPGEQVIFRYSVVTTYDKYWVRMETAPVTIIEGVAATTTESLTVTVAPEDVTEHTTVTESGKTLVTASSSSNSSLFSATKTTTLATTSTITTTSTTPTTTTTITTTTTTTEEPISPFVNPEHPIFNSCGDTKSCFGIPADCLSKKQCTTVVAYELEKINVKFTMVGKSDGYVSIGLSKDTRMGDDLVTTCYYDPNTAKVEVQSSYNEGYSNRPLVPNKVGILEEFEGYYEDGFISCVFRRPEIVDIKDPENTYQLLKDYFVILLAEGMYRDGSMLKHRTRLSASRPTALGISTNLEGKSRLYIQLHGSLMVIAWILLASLGMLIARYFKTTWTSTKIFNKEVWFLFHRALMILTFCLTITAFILIFVELTFEFTTLEITENPHAILGCITTGLCFIQPFIAILRCDSHHSKRGIFDWIHWTVGNLAHIVAFVAIFFAVDLEKAKLPREMDWLLIAFVAFHFIFHIILSFIMCITDAKREKTSSYPMRGFRGGNHLYPEYEELKRDSPGSGARMFLLFIYFLVTVCVTGALIALIVLTPTSSYLRSFNLF